MLAQKHVKRIIRECEGKMRLVLAAPVERIFRRINKHYTVGIYGIQIVAVDMRVEKHSYN